jgi:hypothetical protein
MKKEKKRKTVFKKRIRIRENQLEWLRKNKDTKTMAGFLDKIINKFRKNDEKQKICSNTRKTNQKC